MSEAQQQLTVKDEAAHTATSIIQVIERAALNPNVDIDKMERLLAMQERILAKQSEMAFDAAMADAQAEMRPISADAENPHTRSRYASYAALDNALRPIYTKHGFALSFDTGEAKKEDHVLVLCRVSHRHGHKHVYRIEIPADGKGSRGGDVMTKTHAVGSGCSYGSRYLLKLIFNVAVGEHDDDGNGASAPPKPAEKQPDPVPEGTVLDLIAAMEACATLSDLQKSFASAIVEAAKAKDMKARDRFVETKDKRKAELQKG